MIASDASWEDCIGVRAMARASEARKEVKSRAETPASLGKYNRIAPFVCKAERERQVWRRVTGLTVENEKFADAAERRAGIGRLVKQIEKNVSPHFLPQRTQRTAEGRKTGTENGGDRQRGIFSAGGVRPQQTRMAAPPLRGAIGCTTDWMPEIAAWARVMNGGVSIEGMCEQLGISRARLTRLTKEYCGLSAGELVDGFRLRGLKAELLGPLRSASREIWGAPGNFAEQLSVEGAFSKGASLLSADCEKRSRFFKTVDWKAVREDAAGRVLELLAVLRGRRADSSPYPLLQGEGMHNGEGQRMEEGSPFFEPTGMCAPPCDLETLAMRLGFGSAVKLKRACVTVFGKSLASIERTLAAEIVEYYLCIEEKVLRDLASRAGESGLVCRARYLYSGDDEYRPEVPFLDRYSAMEAFRADWLDRMGGEFG